MSTQSFYQVWYSNFLSSVVKTSKEAFLEYDETKERLDSYLWKFIGSGSGFRSLWTVIQMILVLSHGQATAERGFSENKMLLVENLNMESLIAQRLICDFMKQPYISPVSKCLTDHVKTSRQRYHQSLADNEKQKISTDKNERETNIVSEIHDINAKVSSLEKAIKELQNDVDKFAFEAEKKNGLSVLPKANAL